MIDGWIRLPASVAVLFPRRHRVALGSQPDQPIRHPALDCSINVTRAAPANGVAAAVTIRSGRTPCGSADCHVAVVIPPHLSLMKLACARVSLPLGLETRW
jgi:hypothetical protein